MITMGDDEFATSVLSMADKAKSTPIGKIKIDTGVPVPNIRFMDRGRYVPDLILLMEIGDSFELDIKENTILNEGFPTVKALREMLSRLHRSGDRRYTTRTINEGKNLRLWRIK